MVRVKTLLALMIVSALVVSIFMIYIRDGAFDTIKDNYKTPDRQITSFANTIRKTCEKWQSTDCYALETKTITENLRYKDDDTLQTIFQSDNSVNYTLKNGNDCDGFAVFGASLLHELGVKEIYVIEQASNGTRTDHVSIGARQENGGLIIIYTQKDFEITKIRKLE